MNRLALLVLFATGSVSSWAQHPKLAEAQAQYRQAQARHDTLAMAKAAYLLGKRYTAGISDDYIRSRHWFLQSLQLWEPRGPSIDLNKVYVQLAGSSAAVNDYEGGFFYAHRALANSRQLNHQHSLMSAYGVLGGLYWQVAELEPKARPRFVKNPADSALWYLEKAEAIALQLNQPKDIAGIRYSKAKILVQRDPRKAALLLTYALGVYRQHRMYNNCVLLHTTLAGAYTSLRQLSLAGQHLVAAEQLYRTQKPVDASSMVSIQYHLARWHRAMGHWQAAYSHLHMADSLRYAQLTADQRATIARLNITYETNRRESLLKAQQTELALRDSRLQTQRLYTYASLGLLVLTAMIGFLFYRLNRQNKRISRQNAQLVQDQNHRMKNNLQTIAGLLSLQSSRLVDADARRAVEESQLRVQTMAQLNRKLYDPAPDLSAELPVVIPDLVQSILSSYGYGMLQPDYELEPVPLEVDQVISVALILTELVTNACKYAFPSQANPTLRVSCWQEANGFRLRVQDNGPGMPQTSSSAGFGQSLIAMQVQQLRGKFTIGGPPGLICELWAPITHQGLIYG